MADIVERLTWLSSRHAEHMNDGPRLTDFCHAGREAASVITALRAEVERLREASTGLHMASQPWIDKGGKWRIEGEVLRLVGARCAEAATRIEQLEAALRMQLYSQNLFDALTIARAALGEKP